MKAGRDVVLAARLMYFDPGAVLAHVEVAVAAALERGEFVSRDLLTTRVDFGERVWIVEDRGRHQPKAHSQAIAMAAMNVPTMTAVAQASLLMQGECRIMADLSACLI